MGSMGWLFGLLMLGVGMALGSFLQKKRMNVRSRPGEVHWQDEVDRWKEKATRDNLTGLYNREYFERTVRTLLQEEGYDSGAMIFIDVDNFKQINDTQGHRFGDEVLTWVARQIQGTFRHTDVIARYGGDEFLVFAPKLRQPVLEERLAQLCQTFRGDRTGQVTGSMGAALYPRDGEDFETLMDHADCALYEAKARGKDCFLLYEPTMKGHRARQ